MRIFLILLTMLLSLAPNLVIAQERIAVVVNESAITAADISDRLNLIIASSGLPNTPETREKLSPQIASALIEEQIKMQEAQRLGLEVTQDDVNKGFATVAQQNDSTPENFREMIVKSGLNIASLENQIRAQLAWTNVVQSELRPKIQISERDIDAALERFDANAGKNEYLVSEIFLPVETPSQEGEIRQLAEKLVSDLQSKKAPFHKVAQQFSKAAGAQSGGTLGWVAQGQLPAEVESALDILAKDEISAPVRSLNGYHIVMLRDKRVVSAENRPSRDDIASQLGLQRLELLQRNHFMTLKAKAYIENRAEQKP